MKKLTWTFIACASIVAIAMLGWTADPSSSSSAQPQQKENILKRAWHGTERAGQRVWGGTERAGEHMWGAARGRSGEAGTYLSTSISLPPGIEQKEVRSGDAIGDVLRVATESAVTKAGIDDLVDQFVEGDRHRINQSMNGLANKTQLKDSWNQACNQFKAQWKSKFGHDFDIKKGEEPYADSLYLTEGTITDPNLLTNWPLSQAEVMSSMGRSSYGAAPSSSSSPSSSEPSSSSGMGSSSSSPASPSSSSTSEEKSSSRMGSSTSTYGAGSSTEKGAMSEPSTGAYPREGTGAKFDTPKEANLEKGREVAVAVFPARGGAKELTISFIHEKPDFWKIDVPNNIDGAALYTNLTQHINDLASNVANWPGDEQQARLFVSYHILQACYGLPSSTMGWGAGGIRGAVHEFRQGMQGQSGSSSMEGESGTSGMGSQSGTQGRTPSGGTQGQSTQGSSGSSGY